MNLSASPHLLNDARVNWPTEQRQKDGWWASESFCESQRDVDSRCMRRGMRIVQPDKTKDTRTE